MRLDPDEWALVHDRRAARDFLFWRGLELCVEVCAERIRPGALWVDVGSGTGHLAGALAALGARTIGLDHDPRMTRYARRRWPGAFAAADAFSLPLPDGSCAGLVAVSLLGCLGDPAGLLAEAARVLAPHGTLCLSAMNRHSLLLPAAKLAAWRGRRNAARYTAYDPAALAAAARRAGLLPERQILYGHLSPLGSRGPSALERARRREAQVSPGTRSAWARQILLVATRQAT